MTRSSRPCSSDARRTRTGGGASSGHVVFDLSTVSPESTRRNAARAAEHGVRLIDSPVSGSVSGALSATLAVMIGAPEVT